MFTKMYYIVMFFTGLCNKKLNIVLLSTALNVYFIHLTTVVV